MEELQYHDEGRNDKKDEDGASTYAKPKFSEDEEILVDKMFRLVGNRWHLIAGRIPGRTSEEIEVFCTAKYGPYQR
ncbi:transcription factor CPC-like [Impatiens glandulifera]|uniref:transcription factor CPC-like n=1 Tax=Impatiens glandulifera TaxID=253017 RepID=UPI001FB1721C|nr:transcription factor CPC-like [Impatiens glandulifera]